jgi:hypothetical protein
VHGAPLAAYYDRSRPCADPHACHTGIWSQVKRAPVASKKRKTFEVDGPARTGAMPIDDRARQIFAYFKKYNYEVKGLGDVITFTGLYAADKGQAAAVTFYTFFSECRWADHDRMHACMCTLKQTLVQRGLTQAMLPSGIAHRHGQRCAGAQHSAPGHWQLVVPAHAAVPRCLRVLHVARHPC